jgi:phosphatidylethanolamine/phosphatidyl-N-methylethanolamine N-methyltransferase
VFQDIVFPEGSKVLFVGVGTGADLLFIDSQGIDILAIDISPDMLSKTKEKVREGASITLLEMDAQQLNFEDGTFDFVIANLILCVVPDANKCMQEMVRVTKSNGRIIIFDKFLPSNQKLSFTKKFIKPFIKVLGTDISRSFENIMEPCGENVILKEDMPVLFNGMFRKIVCERVTENQERSAMLNRIN